MNRMVSVFLLSVSLCANGWSQDVAKQDKVNEETRKQITILLAEVLEEAKSLAVPENRIWAFTKAIELAWKSDETQARALVSQAIGSFKEIINRLNDEEQDYDLAVQTIFQLREKFLVTIAKQDAALALEFLEATRQPGLDQSGDDETN